MAAEAVANEGGVEPNPGGEIPVRPPVRPEEAPNGPGVIGVPPNPAEAAIPFRLPPRPPKAEG